MRHGDIQSELFECMCRTIARFRLERAPRSCQQTAEYVRFKNERGEVVRTYKDSYDRAGNFRGRTPLRGGAEGRPVDP